MTGQNKQDIPLFINQTLRTNFADFLTKFNLELDTPATWLEYQRRLLTPNWLQTHPNIWLKQVLIESDKKSLSN